MAGKPTVKVKEGENLSPANIQKVIALLEKQPPITKSDACKMLNISYNTSRLQNIINSYKEKEQFRREQIAKKSGTAATKAEVEYVVQSALAGEPISTIADSLYRSAGFVTNIITKFGVPRRVAGGSYFTPALLPDECVKTEFAIGEKVYSARYQSLARIVAEFKQINPSTPKRKVYQIYLEDERWQQYAYQPVEELGSITHLTNLFKE